MHLQGQSKALYTHKNFTRSSGELVTLAKLHPNSHINVTTVNHLKKVAPKRKVNAVGSFPTQVAKLLLDLVQLHYFYCGSPRG